MPKNLAKELIKRHEGLRLRPYICSAGKLTIGYGRNLSDLGITLDNLHDLAITLEQAEQYLDEDMAVCLDELTNFDWWGELHEVREAAMVDMYYNLGFSRFRKFKKMLAAIAEGDYDRAADEMLDSRWAGQVGRRADTLAGLMRTGEL